MILMIIDWFQLWQQSWPAGVTMLVLGLCFAIGLLIASEKLKVQQDQRVEDVYAALPNVNCGACSFAGCQEYAKAVVADPTLLGRCYPGGQKTAEKIAKILNLQISSTGAPKRPVVHCRAHPSDKTFIAEYQGISSCTAANAIPNFQACKFGCLGFGDCTAACKFDAIHVVDGLAAVDYEKCTGCAACSKACPRNLIEMVPFTHENIITVACNSKEAGRITRLMCKVGCIACGLCARQTDIFSVKDNLARVNYEKYQPDEKTQIALNKCPTGVIIYVGKNAPLPRQAAQKPATAQA